MIFLKKKRYEIIQHIMTAVEYIMEDDIEDESVLNAIYDNLEAAMHLIDKKIASEEIEAYCLEVLLKKLREPANPPKDLDIDEVFNSIEFDF